jgi:hypothetical protein
MVRATASLSDDGKRIEVRFPYDPEAIRALKGSYWDEGVPGATWSKAKRCWTVPLDLTTGRRLREAFGPYLTISDDLRRWGKRERQRLAMLRQLSEASQASLGVLPRVLPELAEKLSARPYQTADIARMAAANALNANEPGTGKTVEVIGTAAEAGLLNKPCLTLAPVASIEDTWARELRACGYPHQVFASEERHERKGWINYAWMEAKDGRPFWLVVNPDIIRVKPAPDDVSPAEVVARDPISGAPYVANQWTDNLLDIDWGLVVIDEFHLFGLTNPRSQFGLAARLLKADRLILASGTPMGGKYKRLWAALNWLYPKQYGSWWKWAMTWLVVKDNGFGKVVKDEIQPGREEEFQRAHAHIFLRRSKLADLPGCPPQVHRVVSCPMTKDQAAQYREFEREAEIRINGQRVSGHGILAEWSRLRAFANARCRVTTTGRKLVATPDSGKLPRLLDVLAEVGVRKKQPEPGARAIVGTMDRSFARITAAFLEEHGIKTGLLIGGVAVAPITAAFRSNDPAPYVIVMTVQKGGVSLNLQEARAAVALDESWNPDDMVQFFDRGDRGSRTTPLLCVTMRTRETIQEYIAEVAGGKEINNKNAYQFLSALRARSSRAGQ